MPTLSWEERDGGLLLDLAGPGGESAGTFLAVRPHPDDPDYWRPVCVLVPGEPERELGDGVLGREHAQDTIVKYAIQVLARAAGLPGTPREDDPEDPWPKRVVGGLWALLAAGPRGA